jgi:hypothetical protein
MVNTKYLEEPLRARSPRELEIISPEYEVLTRHLSRAQYAEAAAVAEKLWSDGVQDVRLLGYYLFGVFIERGLSSLALIFDLIEIALTQSWDFLAPASRKDRHMDTALRWILTQVVHHADHYKRHKDPMWDRWQSPEFKDVVDVVHKRGPFIAALIEKSLPGGRSIQAIYHLKDLLDQLHQDKLASAGFSANAEAELKEREEARVRAMLDSATADEESPTDSTATNTGDDNPESGIERREASNSDTAADRDAQEDGDRDSSSSPPSAASEPSSHSSPSAGSPSSRASAPSSESSPSALSTPGRISASSPISSRPLSAESPPADEAVHEEDTLQVRPSAALRGLLRKLALLDSLCAQRRFRAAGFLLSDLQQALRAFDPVRYFPSLFGGYLRALVVHAESLNRANPPTQPGAGDLRRIALQQLLDSDLDTFETLATSLDEDPR